MRRARSRDGNTRDAGPFSIGDVKHPRDTLHVRVNGRAKYWASKSPIPGGVSFENFEMVDEFKSGQEFWFGVKPEVVGS